MQRLEYLKTSWSFVKRLELNPFFFLAALRQIFMIDLKMSSNAWKEEYRMSNTSQFLELATEIQEGVWYALQNW